MKKETKTYAFIDSQNLNLGVRDCGWILDFAKFRYNVILKPTIIGKKKGLVKTKGNVDAELVLHTMIEFPNKGFFGTKKDWHSRSVETLG